MEYSKKTRIAILGGGISGLTLGYLLKKKDIEVAVFERTHRAGGYIGTKLDAGFLVEFGANGFQNTEPKTLELIKKLNLDAEVIKSNEKANDRFVYGKDKELHKLPARPADLLKSSLFSLSSKFKLFKESTFPTSVPASSNGRSIYDFARDHFGEEIAESVVRPLMIGIFGGDAKNISVNKALPRMVAMEKEYGSMVKAIKALGEKAEKPALLSFKNGMQTLIDALSKQLGENLKLNSYVLQIERQKNMFKVTFQDEVENETFTEEFQDVVFCLPPTALPELLNGLIDEVTLERLEKFPTAPLKSLSIAFQQPLNFKGFGALVSPSDEMKILGFLHPKDIFENRCPEGKDLVTVMLGGTFHPQATNWSLQNGLKIALEALEKIVGKLPAVEKYWVWNHVPGIPQYNTDWTEFMDHFDGQIKATQGLWLHSTISGGVAINDCIRRSFQLADQFIPENYVTKYERNTESLEAEEEF